MKRIRAVLFDFIGTTVLEKDPNFITSCFVSAFANHNVTINVSELSHIRGMDKRQGITLILKSKGLAETIGEQILESFKDHIRQGISKFEQHPELDDVINHLRMRGIKIGIASGLPKDIFRIVFEGFGWDRYRFDYQNVYSNFNDGRPNPALILDMCKKLELSPTDVLKIGDTVSDIWEGKNAGTLTAVVFAGTQPDSVLRDAGADYVLNSLRDILQIISQPAI